MEEEKLSVASLSSDESPDGETGVLPDVRVSVEKVLALHPSRPIFPEPLPSVHGLEPGRTLCSPVCPSRPAEPAFPCMGEGCTYRAAQGLCPTELRRA